MATYTMELRKVIELYGEEEVKSWFGDFDLTDYLNDEEISIITANSVWTKEKLVDQIINHYLMNEIGFETPYLFRHYVKTTIKEIMGNYAPMLYTTAIKYNPIDNVNITTTETRNIIGNASSNSSSNSSVSNNGSSLSVNSDTPQGQINKNAILNGTYAATTSAQEFETNNNDNTTSESSGNSNSSETFTKNETGNRGLYNTNQKLIADYRKNIININKMIIDELSILFMKIY